MKCRSFRDCIANAVPIDREDYCSYVLEDVPVTEESDVEKLEIATQLINLAICEVCLTRWPEYHGATSKVAQLLTVFILDFSNQNFTDWKDI